MSKALTINVCYREQMVDRWSTGQKQIFKKLKHNKEIGADCLSFKMTEIRLFSRPLLIQGKDANGALAERHVYCTPERR